MDTRLSKAYIDLSAFMITHPNTYNVLAAIRRYAVKQLHVPMFFIGLYNESAGMVSFDMAYEDGRKIKLDPLSLDKQARPSLVSHVILTREPIIWMNQAEKDKAIQRLDIQPLGRGKKCCSCWIHPLIAEGELLGVISIQDPRSDAWNQGDLAHFRALVYLASVALANARNRKNSQKAQKVFRDIQSVSSELISSLDSDEILKKIMKHAVSTMGAWRANIVIWGEGHTPKVNLVRGFKRNKTQYSVRDKGVSQWVVSTGLPRYFEDITSTTKDVNPGMFKDGVRSALCLPLIYQGDVVGVIWGHFKERMKFSQEFKDAWTVFSNHASLAYGNAEFVAKLSRVRKIQGGLLDSSFDAIIAIDDHKRIVEFNQQAEILFGYDFSEVEGKSVAIVHASISEARNIDRRLKVDGEITNHPVTLKGRNGKLIPVLLSAKAIRDRSDRKITMQVGYIRDQRNLHLLEDKLKSLISAGKVVSKSLRLKVVSKNVRTAALESFPSAKNCVIHLYDKNEKLLYRISEDGAVERSNRKEAFVPGEGIAGWVFDNGKPLVLDDARKDARFKVIKFRGHTQPKSMMCARLQAGNQPIGTITLHNTLRPGLFKEEDLTLLSVFAYQVGTAIESARNFEKIHREENERKLIRTISEKLHRQRSNKSILKLLADAGKQLLDVEITVAHLVDKTTGEVMSFSAPEGYEITPPRKTKANPTGLTDIIMKSRKVLKIEDAQTDPRVNPKVKAKGIKSLIGFPIISNRGGAIGVIFFDSTRAITFSESNVDLISLLVTQSSTPLFNIMLQKRKQYRVDKLRTLSNFSTDIIRQLPSTENRQHHLILKYLADILEAEGTSLLLVEEPGKLVKKACWGHLTEDFDEGRTFEIHNREGGGLTGWIAYHRKVFRAHGEELRTHPATTGKPNIHLKSGTCSALLSIPLVLRTNGRDQLVGLLEAENKIINRNSHEVDDTLGFTDEDVWIGNIFAKTVLTIMESTRAYRTTKERLERHANSLGFLYGSGKEITGENFELSKILHNIAKRAWTLTGLEGKRASFADIFILDVDGRVAQFATCYPRSETRKISKQIGSGIVLDGNGRIGVIGRAILSRKYQLFSDVKKGNPDYIPTHEETRSELAVPIIFGKDVLGVINVEHNSEAAFNIVDVQDLELLGMQAAIAIWNARFFEQLNKQNQYLQMINKASRVISKGGVENKKEVIDTILQEAVRVVQLRNKARVVLAAFEMVLPGEKEIRLESVIPPSADEYGKVGEIRKLIPAHNNRIGISGQAILDKATIIVPNVNENLNYLKINKKTRSEIDVPLIDGNRSIGTLSLESDQLSSFDEDDMKALEALASLAVIALNNVDSYLDLQKTKSKVGSLTMVAWLSQAASTYGHSIRNRAINISNLIILMRQDLENMSIASEGRLYFVDKLDFIDRLAHEIFDYDISPPSGNPMEAKVISINDLIEERLTQLKKKSRFATIDLQMNLVRNARTDVSVNPEMLGHAFEIVMSNAADAMVNQLLRRLVVSTNLVGDTIEIHFTDTGKGILEEYQSNLFLLAQPTHSEYSLGMGLLIALAIVESNNGEIKLIKSVPGETEFMISFPISG